MPVSRLAAAVLLLGAACSAWPVLAADPPGTTEPAAAVSEDAAAASAAAPAPAHPAQNPSHRPACLTKSEQRAAVASKSAMSLGDAIKSLRAHGRRAEVVRARLC